MKINKFIALIGILIVCFSLVINGSSTYANDKEEVQDQMVINEANKIVLSKKEESQQVDSEKKLVKTLQDSDEKQFDDVIKEYIDNDSVVADKIQENEKVNSIEDIKVVNQNGEEVSSTYNIDDKNQILITSEGLYG
ncbi:hypothetical protein P5G51_018620 [Virgibacillus sp. 179-BFC.A HS]|uniref:Uncharacterized protein n=1 Tax=Tigheibacillus jepli TaxID=3035914 RepID=A0ABU5CL46_9BACI|nr:hypothetical protein [Virgibacillus sp. 179-BFC.A HS]MDY0407077.1 hypothetical protein [Virgibacillus sp. 179-BFC.A HS]